MKITPRLRARAWAMYLQDHRRLFDAERRRRLVQDQHLGPEVDGPRDGHRLPLAAGERADGVRRVANLDPHLVQLFAA